MDAAIRYPEDRLYPFFAMGYMTAIMASIILFPIIVTLGPFEISASLFSYPLTYLFSTIVAEEYGKDKSRNLLLYAMFWGNGYSLCIYLFNLLHIYVPTQETVSYVQVLESDLRYTLAGTIAMWCGTASTMLIVQKTKLFFNKKYFTARSFVAILSGELINTVLVFAIGLFGEIFDIVLSSYTFKAFYAFFVAILATVILFFVRGYETYRTRN